MSLLSAAVLTAAGLRRRRRRRTRLPALAVILSPRHSTLIARDGAVRSAQSAELTLTEHDLQRLWNATNLENLARTYWRFLSRMTLGLIRVVYGPHERRVVLLFRPLTLLRFEAPQYIVEADHGKVSWQIRDGFLVARSGRSSGYLALDVRRQAPGELVDGREKLRIEVEVANFYPSIAAGFSTPVYELTQSAIHVLVTHSFLRSLATLELAESKVRTLGAPGPAPTASAEADPTHLSQLGPVVAGGDPPHGA